ncbi:hypothetical protein HY212_00580 [Candidatus Pacearchaeota archaeon]|nr:hypothetical protein [Candidatus Pacearchaeota archaeon]
MKSNSIGQIYANFTFHVLDNHTWNLTPSLHTNLSDPNPIASKNLTIIASPNSITANKSNVSVTFTITAKNDIKGVYSLFLFFCGESPLVVGLDESKVNPAIFNQFFNAQYMCPMMSGATPEMNIAGYYGMISKTISTIPSDTNNVEIQNIQVQPTIIKVGDTFTVNATLVNNSPNTIFLQHGVCDGPFSVVFDNHVTVNQNQIVCPMIAMLQKINPGEKITITSPGSALTYRATTSGTANATVTIPYTIDQTDQSQSEIAKTISKSFSFTITKSSSQTIPVLSSPLKQFKSGIAAQDVTCKEGLQLVIKAKDNSPACVQSSTAAKLVTLGWAKIQENNGVLVTLTEGQREGPLLVQKIFPDSIQGLDFREYPLATNVGYPITLHIGDSASNGCTVELTLVKISNGTATFLKKEYQNRPCPICLSENTVIDTPSGPINVKELKIGMTVLTQNISGHKQTGMILKTGRTLVPQNHVMVHVVLADKRELYVSQNHPTSDGRLFGELLAGDTLDGSKIKSAEQVPYNGTFTYDILPSGQTGFYWADGILVASTLK